MKLARRQSGDNGVSPHHEADFGPFNQLSRIRSEINRIFEDPLSVLPSTSFFEGWEPAVDIYEDKDKITIRAELPGMQQRDIQLSVENNTLTISGERKRDEQRKEGDTFRSERFYGRFQRSITLPQPVDSGRISATYRDGVLTVICPKSEEAKSRQIEVKAE